MPSKAMPLRAVVSLGHNEWGQLGVGPDACAPRSSAAAVDVTEKGEACWPQVIALPRSKEAAAPSSSNARVSPSALLASAARQADISVNVDDEITHIALDGLLYSAGRVLESEGNDVLPPAAQPFPWKATGGAMQNSLSLAVDALGSRESFTLLQQEAILEQTLRKKEPTAAYGSSQWGIERAACVGGSAQLMQVSSSARETLAVSHDRRCVFVTAIANPGTDQGVWHSVFKHPHPPHGDHVADWNYVAPSRDRLLKPFPVYLAKWAERVDWVSAGGAGNLIKLSTGKVLFVASQKTLDEQTSAVWKELPWAAQLVKVEHAHEYSLGLLKNGNLMAWGVGIPGTTTTSKIPIEKPEQLLTEVADMSAGNHRAVVVYRTGEMASARVSDLASECGALGRSNSPGWRAVDPPEGVTSHWKGWARVATSNFYTVALAAHTHEVYFFGSLARQPFHDHGNEWCGDSAQTPLPMKTYLRRLTSTMVGDKSPMALPISVLDGTTTGGEWRVEELIGGPSHTMMIVSPQSQTLAEDEAIASVPLAPEESSPWMWIVLVLFILLIVAVPGALWWRSKRRVVTGDSDLDAMVGVELSEPANNH